MDKIFDVVICGGGLAGQTLARQLKLKFPQKSIAVVVKTAFPLPKDAFKVGESSVEISCFYFSEVLQLQDYFKNGHYKKLGFRFFFGPTDQCLSERPEIGISAYPSFDSYQMDRGILENDLYRMNKSLGVEIIERASVKNIEISDDDLSSVAYTVSGENETNTILGKWVIDAMGRKCFLQRKFDLLLPPRSKHSSVWFRVEGRLDVDDFVPEEEAKWHQRVPNRIRYFSTNHFLGKGYWVWLIPLPSGNTSVGIVTAEEVHPLSSYDTPEKALKWLQENEVQIYNHMKDFSRLDFGRIKNYSYKTKQVFSEKRWACVGEAAFFADPFYSPGSNMIAYENLIVEKLIALDDQNDLKQKDVEFFNNFIISTNDYLTKSIQDSYDYFDKENIKALSFLWDITVGWSFGTPFMMNTLFLSGEKFSAVQKAIPGYFPLLEKVYMLFQEWKDVTNNSYTFDYIDYLSIPFVKEIYKRNVQSGKPLNVILEDQKMNLERLEEFALVIFELAVEDVHPEEMNIFKGQEWLNAWGIGLDPNKWEADKLFKPITETRSLNKIRYEIRSLFNFENSVSDVVEEEKNVQANLSF